MWTNDVYWIPKVMSDEMIGKLRAQDAHPADHHSWNSWLHLWLNRCQCSFNDEKGTKKILSTVNGWAQSWRKAACIAREDTVIAKIRSLIVNQTQYEEIPNTHGFLAKCYDKEEESKFTTKQLSPNVQCRNLWKNPRKVNVSDKWKAKAALKSNATLMRD